MEKNVKFVAVGRNEDSVFVATYNFETPGDIYSNEAAKILRDQNPIAQTLINLVQRITTNLGEWNVLCDQDRISYFVLTKQDYPSRHATALLEKIKLSFRN